MLTLGHEQMIIPIKDILSTEASQAWALGHHGLVVNLRGYEELFFEFSHVERRTAVAALLDHRKEKLGRSGSGTDASAATGDGRTALIYDDFEPGSSSQSSGAEPSSASSDLARSLDPMFTSTSSTFLRFKPAPLHFTFLTIGSRGDVQPYIALAKGLLADGHRCKIATHGEFKDWIEGQGIEYGYVGGDPAELMRLSVENGMFTVSFIKEGLQKVISANGLVEK
jgi:sterol 3beta-glucosyltransferase